MGALKRGEIGHRRFRQLVQLVLDTDSHWR